MGNEQKLNDIIVKVFGSEIPKEYYCQSFFMPPIMAKARHFLILFMEVEKEFNIKIPDEYIMKRKIDTYDTLLKVINELTE